MDDDTKIQKIDLDKIDWRGSREFFESLGEALDKLDDKDEAYDFTWVGKRKSIIEAGAPINKTFRPDIEASKNWDTTENLFIEGDNLDALKLLQESYLGKVKMIYIDPPYNTGKDFVYHDNFKAKVEEYDEATEYKDESGNIQFKKNEKSNGRYHSDWLSMMYPRLKLARNLLTDDGVIFISIDDNEQANLKKLCDEIYGEDNFVAQFVWKRRASSALADFNASTDHEYVLCYQKGEFTSFKGVKKDYISYKNANNDPKGPWMLDNLTVGMTKDQRPNQFYNLVDPKTGKSYSPNPNRVWAYIKESMNKLIADGRVYFPEEVSKRPMLKRYKNDLKTDTNPISTFMSSEKGEFRTGLTSEGTKVIQDLFNSKIIDYPKPVSLVKSLVKQVTFDNDIILDFFAGSATTSHAVLEINKEDGGNRKFIMAQLPEPIDEDSEAYKAGYKTIPDIARERIRRAGDKIAKENPEAKVDYGFRALTIADTNYKEVYKSAGEYEQPSLLDAVDNIKEDRTELDLLYGVLTATALELNRPFEKRDIAGSTVYLYDYFSEVSGLIACFSESVSEDAIKEIAKLKPLTAVFRDSSFPDSQAKVNLSEHFRIISPDTKVKVI